MTPEQDKTFDAFLGLLTTVVMASADKRFVDPSECEHLVRVAASVNRNVCMMCRSVFDEPSFYGISISEAGLKEKQA